MRCLEYRHCITRKARNTGFSQPFLYAIESTDDLSKSEEEQIVFPTAASLGDEPFLPSGGSREGQISVTSTDDNVAPELKMMLYFKSR